MKQQKNPSSSNDQRQKNNSPSNILTADENETVFGLLGRKCQVSSYIKMLNVFTFVINGLDS